MSTIRFDSKEAFIAALEDRRKFWKEFDKRQEREHKDAERGVLAQGRAKMREALKWDYATLKANLDWSGDLRIGKAPDCPVLMEPKIDRLLASLRITNGKTFVVSTDGVWSGAHHLLTHDPDARLKVC